MSLDIDNFLAEQELPSVVAIGLSATDILYEGGFGVTNTETSVPVNIDTPYSIMSMTKPITSLAIMQQVENGVLDLSAPVSDYLPEYAELVALAQVDANKKAYSTVNLKRQITVHDLLTHTSGLGYAFCNENMSSLFPESEQPLFPLCHQPGEAWTYGRSTRVLGEIVANTHGTSLDTALQDMILQPLGMTQTSFEPQPNQAQVHTTHEGSWIPSELSPRIEMGDGGLISTARDYARFLQCLLNKGTPLISEASFQKMISNQIDDLFVTEQPAANLKLTNPFPTGSGIDKFGYGFQLHMNPPDQMRSAGSYSWCGLYNTYFWGDPVHNVGGIILMQCSPLYSSVCRETLDGFETRFYQSLL